MSGNRIPFPQAIQIELTSYCNLKCLMCPKTLNKSRSEPDRKMDIEILDYLITSVIPYVERVDLVGDGEPLLAGDLLFHLLENADFLGIPVTLCTNGQLLDEPMSRKLVDLNLQDMNISIDAATGETYRKIRGADFDQLIRNIQTLNTVKESGNKSIPHLHFSMVAMRNNIEELPALIDLARKLGVESVTLQALGEESEDLKGQSAFLYHRDLTEEILYRCLVEAESEGFRLNLWPDQLTRILPTDIDLNQFLSGNAPPPGNPDEYRKDCSFLWKAPYITTNGDVRPCCAGLPAAGNIGKGNAFREIWFGRTFSELRLNILKNNLPEACLNCPGMGWKPVLKAKNTAHATDEILGRMPGWYSPELEERHFRWCTDRSVLFFHRSPSEKFLLMQLRKTALPGAPSSGQIGINSFDPIPFKLESTDWETLEFPLPETRSEELIKVVLEPSHTIRPIDIDPASRDSRKLGFKISRTWLEEWPQKVVFGSKLVLLGYEIIPESWVLEGEVLFRSFWRSLDQTVMNLKVGLHFSRESDSGPATSPLRRKFGISRKDFFQADHLLSVNGKFSSMWVPGTFIAHEHLFHVPDDIHAGHYRLELGLYPEGSPRERVPITRSDRVYDKDMTLLGTILITEREL